MRIASRVVIGVIGVIGLTASAHAAPVCEVGDAEDCEAKCATSDYNSCGVLGSMYADGRGVAQDVLKASLILQDGCNHHAAHACLGLAVLSETGSGVPKDAAAAVRVYRDYCETKHEPYGCVRLASAYLAGHGVAADPAKAVELLTSACTAGEMSACMNLGYVAEAGAAGAKDLARAQAMYQRACDHGSGIACGQLALFFEEGRGVAADAKQARRYYQAACDHHLWTACTHVAYLREHGVDNADEISAARALYKSACDHHELEGCNKLATMDVAGRGNYQSDSSALAGYKRACDGGNADGCANEGWLILHGGNGITADDKRGLELLHNACKAKSTWACTKLDGLLLTDAKCAALTGVAAANCDNDLGLAYASGIRGVTKNGAKAIALYTKACDAGVNNGCANLGFELYMGKLTTRDVPRGVTLLIKACSDGNKWACGRVRDVPDSMQDPTTYPAWATDGPIKVDGPGCRTIIDLYMSTPDPHGYASRTDRYLARLNGLKRPATASERVWRECKALKIADLKHRRADIDAIQDDNGSQSTSSTSSDDKASELKCKSDCQSSCRPSSPGDACMVAQHKCERGCEGR